MGNCILGHIQCTGSCSALWSQDRKLIKEYIRSYVDYCHLKLDIFTLETFCYWAAVSMCCVMPYWILQFFLCVFSFYAASYTKYTICLLLKECFFPKWTKIDLYEEILMHPFKTDKKQCLGLLTDSLCLTCLEISF